VLRVVGFAFAFFLTALPADQAREPLLVSAAISQTDALEEIRRAYAAAGGGEIRFNFAGSNVLVRQIVNGAPADVFISADEAQMDYARERGAIDAASRVAIVSNRLAIVTAPGRAATIRDAADLVRAKRIAVADPAAVPAGVYARTYLERRGLWAQLEKRLVPLSNVRAALTAVESGAADAGIVYESDAATSKRAETAFVVTGPDAPRIVYPAAIATRTRHRAEAEKFLAFLRSPAARTIFLKYRFS
jgi:molybdate transport system substrate-binding protein